MFDCADFIIILLILNREQNFHPFSVIQKARFKCKVQLSTQTTVSGSRVSTSVCLSVCLSVCFFARYTASTDAARITKLNTEMFQNSRREGNLFLLELKDQQSRRRVTKHCRLGSLHCCGCWFLLVYTAPIWSRGFKQWLKHTFLELSPCFL